MRDVPGLFSRTPYLGVSWVTPGKRESDRYLQAVRAAGGEPVPLPAGASSWAGELALIRGLLLTGGGDVDPAYYGQGNPENLSQWIVPERDEREWEALEYCLDRGLPVLGVCRGMQLLNVHQGGSLLQDIRRGVGGRVPHHTNPDRSSSFHRVRVLPGTRLAEIVGARESLRVNSRHHQGLTARQLAPGLRASALALDGVIEGVEREEAPFLVGVQCHPERTGEAPAMEALFAALVERARSSFRVYT